MPKMKTDNEVKIQNRIKIIKFVLDHHYVSRQDIASCLGFSMPTVFSYVTELLDRDILCETGEFDSTGGRKAKVLSLATGNKYVIGMDITFCGVEGLPTGDSPRFCLRGARLLLSRKGVKVQFGNAS